MQLFSIGLFSKCLHKLQRVQNSAARIVTRPPPTDHVTQALQKLHWFPVKCHIGFKILILPFRTLHSLVALCHPLTLSDPFLRSISLRHLPD